MNLNMTIMEWSLVPSSKNGTILYLKIHVSISNGLSIWQLANGPQ